MNQVEPSLPVIKDRDKKYHLDKSFLSQPRAFGNIRLFQIGRMFCTENTEIAVHAHINWFELTIATDGEGIIRTGGEDIPLQKGDIYLSFPCDFHGIRSSATDPLKFYFIAFGVDETDLYHDLERIMEQRMAPDRRIIHDETIRALVANAIAEIDSGERYSDGMMAAILSQIVLLLIRDFLDGPSATRGDVTDQQALCYRLMNYIDTHIYTMTGLEELSLLTNYNYSYLSALFRRVTSGTLTEYYRSRRLETARALLEENERSITHIAELLNYSSIYTFSRAFKDKYGVSPEQYRRGKNAFEVE